MPPISWGNGFYKEVSILKATMKDGRVGLGGAYTSSEILKSVWHEYQDIIDFSSSDLRHVQNIVMDLCSKEKHQAQPDLIPALSALDIAHWDLQGQDMNKPIAAMIGGITNSRIKAYASLEIPLPYDQAGFDYFQRKLEMMIAQNFKAIKLYFPGLGYRNLKVWGPSQWDHYEEKLFCKAREIVGPEVDLMLDVFGSAEDWPENMEWAKATAERLQQYGFLWFEEPLRPDNLLGYKILGEKTSIALSACEFFTSPAELEYWAEQKAVSILQPDCTCSGGISTLLRVRDVALANGLAMIPHGWSTAIGMAADIQVMATMPPGPFRMVEYMPKPSVTDLLVGNPFSLDDEGMITVPTEPGLGVNLQ